MNSDADKTQMFIKLFQRIKIE